MLIEFDQSTLANMTAALEYVCKRLPAEKDTPEARKRIADEMIACAKSGRRTFLELQDAGAKVLDGIVQPKRSRWIGWISG